MLIIDNTDAERVKGEILRAARVKGRAMKKTGHGSFRAFNPEM